MKTIYTDKYWLLPSFLLLVAGYMFWSAYRAFLRSDGGDLGLDIGVGGLFLILALKRLWDVRRAKREGQGPSIIRNNHASN